MVFVSLSSILNLGLNVFLSVLTPRSRSGVHFPPLVPAVHTFQPSSGSFKLPESFTILVDQRYIKSTRDNGLTLIPPPLLSFAQTFASDLRELFPSSSATISIVDGDALNSLRDYVFLTLSSEGNHTLADGSPTTEGYEMDVTSSSITIRGSGSKGAFWATRTLLQGLVLGDGRFPNGVIIDQPDWETRGIMLDAGRHWYPISFLKEVCAYASWFKMSEFHVHLSDNVNPEGHPDAYARFRLRAENPEFDGLAPHVNETYSRAEFEDFQQSCAARGVTVIPEIESPGHALVITQWKPELALSTDFTLINLTVPDAIPTIKSIWREYLPWLHSSKSESNKCLLVQMNMTPIWRMTNNFVNDMSDFIQQEANKSMRIWSTLEPSNKTSVSKAIIKQHWDFSQGDPYGLIQEGYNVINSEDSIHYIVVKDPWGSSFPEQLNQTRLWDGANVNTGGIWDPHIFDRGNASNNPSITEPLLKGSIMAVWNDHGPNASTVLEAFYSLKQGLPVIAAANWQAASRPNHLTHAQFLRGYPMLEAAAPGQNLDRRVPSRGAIVVDYHVSEMSDGAVRDTSGNGYDARLSGDVLHTPLGSKGHNYTLRITASFSETPETLLAGPDSSFGIISFNHRRTLAFTSDNITYPLLNYTLPASFAELIVTGTENRTTAWVDAKLAGDFVIGLDGTQTFEPMAFVAPVQEIGGRGTKIKEFILWNGLQEISQVTEYK